MILSELFINHLSDVVGSVYNLNLGKTSKNMMADGVLGYLRLFWMKLVALGQLWLFVLLVLERIMIHSKKR